MHLFLGFDLENTSRSFNCLRAETSLMNFLLIFEAVISALNGHSCFVRCEFSHKNDPKTFSFLWASIANGSGNISKLLEG